MSRRIQLRRGQRLPGGAKYVGRPSRWGNPYRIGDPVTTTVLHGYAWFDDKRLVHGAAVEVFDRRAAVVAYSVWLRQQLRDNPAFLEPLRGYVLACRCPVELGLPCHADEILAWFETHPMQPAEGERPVLGIHRQLPDDADTAPAWTPRTEASRIARFKRWVKGAPA
jgi:hypothetical protein